MRSKALRTREPVEAQAAGSRDGTAGDPAWVRHAVAEIQAGRDPDDTQFGLLFRHYEPRCRYLLISLGLRKDLDDVVQDAIWRVYRSIGAFRRESSFETWLGRIVKNVAWNAFRDRNTEKAKLTETSLDKLRNPDDGEEGAFPEPIARDPDPLESALGAEREAELDALLQQLPPRMRQSMLLFYVHGFRQSEIATLQGTSVNTVKKQLVNGRKRIRPLFSLFAELFSLLLVLLWLAV